MRPFLFVWVVVANQSTLTLLHDACFFLFRWIDWNLILCQMLYLSKCILLEKTARRKKKKRQIKDHIGYAHLVSWRVWENRYTFPFLLSVLHCFQAGASACCCVVTQIHMFRALLAQASLLYFLAMNWEKKSFQSLFKAEAESEFECAFSSKYCSHRAKGYQEWISLSLSCLVLFHFAWSTFMFIKADSVRWV